MTLQELVRVASNKTNFTTLAHYVDFCRGFLDFMGTPGNLQAEIVSRNETHYRFLQFKGDGSFNVTRPLNYNLLYSKKDAGTAIRQFLKVLAAVRKSDTPSNRIVVNRSIYTIQQCIGASLDAGERRSGCDGLSALSGSGRFGPVALIPVGGTG